MAGAVDGGVRGDDGRHPDGRGGPGSSLRGRSRSYARRAAGSSEQVDGGRPRRYRGGVPPDRGPQARLTLTARLDLEYDGTRFAGWARQPGLRTVQGVVEEAIAAVGGGAVALTVAGGTEAGVHARGQVASHDGEPAPAPALNGVLPADVRVLRSERAEEAFDARRDAVSRTYRYRVLARAVASPFEQQRALHWRHPLDRAALDTCAAALLGTHEFTAFTPTQTAHVRFERDVSRAEWLDEEGAVLAF